MIDLSAASAPKVEAQLNGCKPWGITPHGYCSSRSMSRQHASRFTHGASKLCTDRRTRHCPRGQ